MFVDVTHVSGSLLDVEVESSNSDVVGCVVLLILCYMFAGTLSKMGRISSASYNNKMLLTCSWIKNQYPIKYYVIK